jgi:hypothetical protein
MRVPSTRRRVKEREQAQLLKHLRDALRLAEAVGLEEAPLEDLAPTRLPRRGV